MNSITLVKLNKGKIIGLVCILTLLLSVTSFAVEYKESPILKEKVDNGELSPVAERLPAEPKLVEADEVGKFGGSLRIISNGRVTRSKVIEPAFRMATLTEMVPKTGEIKPHVAKGWDINDDATKFTFYLREGMRWSDGHPFTADDLLFMWNDVGLNKELNPVSPAFMRVSGENGVIKKIDDYTVSITFAEPNPIFLTETATYWGHTFATYPKHYLQQFHPKYTDKDKLKKLAKDKGLDTWMQLFEDRSTASLELPQLQPYLPVNFSPENPVIAKRNPYYWVVDQEGNQLPYIDQIEIQTVDDLEVLNMKLIAGEVDFYGRNPGQVPIELLPMLKKNESKGNYSIYRWHSKASTENVISFNVAHPDPVKQKIFGDRRFRIAVSHAIDRKQINDLLYYGMAGEPRQPSVFEGSPFYYEPLATDHLEYDLEKAKSLLNEMGLKDQDGDGWRDMSNGKRLEIAFLIHPRHKGPELGELLIKYLEDLGIKANMRVTTDHMTVIESYQFDATTWTGNHISKVLVDPRNIISYQPYTSFFAPAWADWYQTGGEGGIEPSAEMQQALQYYDKAVTSKEKEEQVKWFKKVQEIAAENLWTIGTCDPPPSLALVSNDLHNVPQDLVLAWDMGMSYLKSVTWWLDR